MTTPEPEKAPKKIGFPLNMLLAIADFLNIYRLNEGNASQVVGVYPPEGSPAKPAEKK